ncbi:MAG: hypothetical protein MJZ92_05535 [Paludibacteraceae bacterium]|nr:hypothetical protein [Paludibacteraceae bacterium]
MVSLEKKVYDLERSAMNPVLRILNKIYEVADDEKISLCKKAITMLNQAAEQNKQLQSQSEAAYCYYHLSIIENLGICYHMLKDYTQAESYFCQAVDLCRTDKLSMYQMSDRSLRILVRCLSEMVDIYKEQKQDDKRERCLKELIDIYGVFKTSIWDSYMMDAMACSAELARLYYTQQRYKEAQALLNTATPYLEEYVVEQSNYEYIHDLVSCYVTQELINEKMQN